MATPQIWSWDSFSWGEGDWFYLSQAGWYRMAKNADTRRVENGVISCNSTSYTETYLWSVVAVNNSQRRTFSTFDGTTNRLYYVGSLGCSVSSWNANYDKIVGFATMKRNSDGILYDYAISQTVNWVGKVHRISTWYGWLTYNIATFTLANAELENGYPLKMSVLNVAARSIFAYANTVFQIDQNEVVKELISFPRWFNIIGITQYQDSFKIYANNMRQSTSFAQANVYVWDGTSSTVSQSAQFDNSPIMSVSNNWAVDYVIFGTQNASDIFAMQWLVRQAIRNNIEDSAWNSRVFLSESIVYNDIVYVLWQNKVDSSYCVYSLGSYYPGTPVSLVPENTVLSTLKFTADESFLYFLYDGKIYKRSILLKDKSWTWFEIYSYACTWARMATEKTVDRVDIAYLLANASDSIKIYARKTGSPYSDNSTGWILLRDITGATDLSKRWITITSWELSSKNIGNFYQLEYKVVCTNTTTTSSIFLGIWTLYLDNIND